MFVADTGHNKVTKLSSSLAVLESYTDGFSSPVGVALTSTLLFVADSGHNRIAVLFIANGSQAHSYTDGGGLSAPAGVAVDSSGRIYVADTGNNRVVVLASNGSQLHSYTGFSSPRGIGVDGAGQSIYVADTGNNRVVVLFASNGTHTRMFTGGLSAPAAIAVDSAGDIVVADTGHKPSRAVLLNRRPAAQLH